MITRSESLNWLLLATKMEAQQFQSEINVNCMQTIKFWYIQYQVLTCTLLIDTFEEDSWVWPQRPGGGGGCLKQMENLFGANWSTASKMLNIKVNRVGWYNFPSPPTHSIFLSGWKLNSILLRAKIFGKVFFGKLLKLKKLLWNNHVIKKVLWTNLEIKKYYGQILKLIMYYGQILKFKKIILDKSWN